MWFRCFIISLVVPLVSYLFYLALVCSTINITRLPLANNPSNISSSYTLHLFHQEMAVVSSATACAPITSHNTSLGSITNLANISVNQTNSSEPHTVTSTTGTSSGGGGTLPPGVGSGVCTAMFHSGGGGGGGGSLAGRLHGLTEKFSSLGRASSGGGDGDSTSSGRCRTGGAIRAGQQLMLLLLEVVTLLLVFTNSGEWFNASE